MSKLGKAVIITLLVLFGLFLLIKNVPVHNVVVLNPKGVIASKERDLMITATLLMLIVVIPVFIMLAAFSWRYRAGNKKAKYTPDWDHNILAEFIWWALPCAIILVLGILAFRSSNELDPSRQLDTATQPITVQVVALQWKWLFIYPEQNIATVNYLDFPVATPVNFQITSDAPMNSFWIPQLGGQIYAMAGMNTQLHLMANQVGSYRGVSANISGRGFADMHFTARATSSADFTKWVSAAKRSPYSLSLDEYNSLAEPSENNPPTAYSSADPGLYHQIVMKYMMPMSNTSNVGIHSDHNHNVEGAERI